jgi:hypothetical protein
MTDKCECELCRRRELHPELTPTSVDRVDGARGKPVVRCTKCDWAIIGGVGYGVDGHCYECTEKQIEEFTEFAADGMSLDDSELSAKSWEGPAFSDKWARMALDAIGDKWLTYVAPEALAPSDYAQRAFDNTTNLEMIDPATKAEWKRRLAESAELVPADDHETHERVHAETRDRLGLPPQYATAKAREERLRALGFEEPTDEQRARGMFGAGLPKYATSELAPVDCRACGRVLGSPEEFMAHECAAETNDA